jgi:hypothetical protein
VSRRARAKEAAAAAAAAAAPVGDVDGGASSDDEGERTHNNSTAASSVNGDSASDHGADAASDTLDRLKEGLEGLTEKRYIAAKQVLVAGTRTEPPGGVRGGMARATAREAAIGALARLLTDRYVAEQLEGRYACLRSGCWWPRGAMRLTARGRKCGDGGGRASAVCAQGW